MGTEKLIGGVYIIKNLINQKIYVGSSRNIKKKWKKHRHQLRKNIHGNEHLQASWNKHGVDNFNFTVWEICSEEVMLNRESYWVELYQTLLPEKGYNCFLPNNLLINRPKSEKSKTPPIKYILININTKEKLEKTARETVAVLNLKTSRISRYSGYWRKNKNTKKSRNGWIVVHPKDYDENFDYIGFDAQREHWKNYIPKPKRKYYKPKQPSEIIPYCKRNLTRSPILIYQIETKKEIKCESIAGACKEFGLVSVKVYKCLNNEFGKYHHHGLYFKRI